MKRFLLSVYFYEKLGEGGKFFDAWWQFSHRVFFYIILLIPTIINIGCSFIGVTTSPYLVGFVGAPLLLLLYMKNDFRDSQLYRFIMAKYKEVKPVPKWVIWGFEILIILVFIWSLTFNIDLTDQ